MKCIRKDNNEIIIHLSHCYNKGHKIYDLAFDFLEENDLIRFNQNDNCPIKLNKDRSLISLRNYASSKPLVEDQYYSINMSRFIEIVLGRDGYENEDYDDDDEKNYNQGDESLFIAYEFKCSKKREDRENVLFLPHKPLKFLYEGVKGNEAVIPDVTGKIKVNVLNVCLGNQNEVLVNDEVKYVFDIGSTKNYGKKNLRSLIEFRIKEYERYKPVLIISHWDLDHVCQLKEMSVDEIKNFSRIICPYQTPGVASDELVEKIINSGVPVQRLNPPSKTPHASHYLMKEIKRKGNYVLYMGEENTRINFSGLALFVHGNTGNALLTGECMLVQANDILAKEAKCVLNDKEHYLVVPHHGGFYTGEGDNYYNVPANLTAELAAISAKDHKGYHIPNPAIIDQMEGIFNDLKKTKTDCCSSPCKDPCPFPCIKSHPIEFCL